MEIGFKTLFNKLSKEDFLNKHSFEIVKKKSNLRMQYCFDVAIVS